MATENISSIGERDILTAELTTEEKEMQLAKKIEDIRKKNKEREKRHAEIEADKRLAVGSNAAVKALPVTAGLQTKVIDASEVINQRQVEVEQSQEHFEMEASSRQLHRDESKRTWGRNPRTTAASSSLSVSAGRSSAAGSKLLKKAPRDSSLLTRHSMPGSKPGRRREQVTSQSARPASDGGVGGREDKSLKHQIADADQAAETALPPAGSSRLAASKGLTTFPHAHHFPWRSVTMPPWGKHRRANGTSTERGSRAAQLQTEGSDPERHQMAIMKGAQTMSGAAITITSCNAGGSVASAELNRLQGSDAPPRRGKGRGRGQTQRCHEQSYEEIRKKNAAAYEEELQRSAQNIGVKSDLTASGVALPRGFLADRGRDSLTDFSRTNEEHRLPSMRHRRNFGGGDADLEHVKGKVKVVSEMQAAAAPIGPPTSRLDMEMRMTGRERRAYSAWREERERIDEERLGRARTNLGGWRREWDAEKRQAVPEQSAAVSPWPGAESAAAIQPPHFVAAWRKPATLITALRAAQPGENPGMNGNTRKAVGSGRFVSQGDKRKLPGGRRSSLRGYSGACIPRPSAWTSSCEVVRRVTEKVDLLLVNVTNEASPRGTGQTYRGGWRGRHQQGQARSSGGRGSRQGSPWEDTVVIHVEGEDEEASTQKASKNILPRADGEGVPSPAAKKSSKTPGKFQSCSYVPVQPTEIRGTNVQQFSDTEYPWQNRRDHRRTNMQERRAKRGLRAQEDARTESPKGQRKEELPVAMGNQAAGNVCDTSAMLASALEQETLEKDEDWEDIDTECSDNASKRVSLYEGEPIADTSQATDNLSRSQKEELGCSSDDSFSQKIQQCHKPIDDWAADVESTFGSKTSTGTLAEPNQPKLELKLDAKQI